MHLHDVGPNDLMCIDSKVSDGVASRFEFVQRRNVGMEFHTNICLAHTQADGWSERSNQAVQFALRLFSIST